MSLSALLKGVPWQDQRTNACMSRSPHFSFLIPGSFRHSCPSAFPPSPLFYSLLTDHVFHELATEVLSLCLSPFSADGCSPWSSLRLTTRRLPRRISRFNQLFPFAHRPHFFFQPFRQQNAWQRDQLLPTHTNSGRSSPYDPSKMTDRDMLSLESQNDEELSGLHSKVAMLKKVEVPPSLISSFVVLLYF